MASASNCFTIFVFSVLLAAVLVSGFQFEVGEQTGWTIPTGKEPQTYNEWAAKNRFHIGDTIHFKYHKDSVLVVASADYLNCNASNPISKYEDGNTVFQFDRPGFFYFISGQPGHCRSGQRLIIRVMHPSIVQTPAIAPSPAVIGDSGDWGQPGVSSSSMLPAISCLLMTAIAGLFALICLFM